MKRALTFLMASVMFISLTACGGGGSAGNNAQTGSSGASNAGSTANSNTTDSGSEANNANESGEGTIFPKQTWKIYCGDSLANNTTQWSETEIGKIVAEKTGITLDCEYIVGANEEEKAGLMVASGDYPDIIIPHNVIRVFRDAGALVELNDIYDKNADNLKRLWGDKVDRIKDPDSGVLWGLGMSYNGPSIDYPFSGFFIKNAAAALNGYKVIDNPDDYFNAIREYVKANPKTNGQDTIGFSGPADDWRFVFTLHGGNKIGGWHNTGDRVYDPNNNYSVINTFTFKERHDYLVRLFELNRDGLLDPEMLSQTHDQYQAKVASGRVVGFYDEYWEVQDALHLIKTEDRGDDMFVPMPVINSGVKADPYAGIQALGTQLGITITTKAKDPETIFKFMDYMASDEMTVLRYWGVEGTHYQKDDSGRRFLTAAQYAERDGGPAFADKTGINHAIGNAMPHPLELFADLSDGGGTGNPQEDIAKAQIIYNDTEKAVLANFGWKTFMDGMGPMWKSPYGYGWDVDVPTDDDALNEILRDVNDINPPVYFQKMILANSLDELEGYWDELQKKLIEVDSPTLDKFYEGVIRDRVENWK